jgi:hypothetical protein
VAKFKYLETTVTIKMECMKKSREDETQGLPATL